MITDMLHYSTVTTSPCCDPSLQHKYFFPRFILLPSLTQLQGPITMLNPAPSSLLSAMHIAPRKSWKDIPNELLLQIIDDCLISDTPIPIARTSFYRTHSSASASYARTSSSTRRSYTTLKIRSDSAVGRFTTHPTTYHTMPSSIQTQ